MYSLTLPNLNRTNSGIWQFARKLRSVHNVALLLFFWQRVNCVQARLVIVHGNGLYVKSLVFEEITYILS